METLGREDIERLMFFEQAREQAEKDYAENNRNTSALTRWGGSLLELAHFRQGNEAYEMIELAVSKFKQALAIDSRKHDALWCLGNAYTSQGFLTTDTRKAHGFFDQATDCFKKALIEEPTSEVYLKALEMTSKAPELHAELQRQLAGTPGGLGGGSRAASSAGKNPYSDFLWDVSGWVCLLGIGLGIAALSRNQAAAQARL